MLKHDNLYQPDDLIDQCDDHANWKKSKHLSVFETGFQRKSSMSCLRSRKLEKLGKSALLKYFELFLYLEIYFHDISVFGILPHFILLSLLWQFLHSVLISRGGLWLQQSAIKGQTEMAETCSSSIETKKKLILVCCSLMIIIDIINAGVSLHNINSEG